MHKILPFSKRQNKAKNNNNIPSRTFDPFLQEVMCVTAGFNAYSLAPKLLQPHPDTKYI